MLTTHLDAGRDPWLIIGNGPSAWGIDATVVRRARVAARWHLQVVACNRTALDVPVDYAAAQDREMVATLLRAAVQRRATLMVEQGALASLHLERPELLTGLVDGKNLLVFPTQASGTGTGDAVFHSLCLAGARTIILVGFDGSADRRTRWSGYPGYRQDPTSAHQFEEWERRMATSARRAAVEFGRVPTIARVGLSDRANALSTLVAIDVVARDAAAAAEEIVHLCARPTAAALRSITEGATCQP